MVEKNRMIGKLAGVAAGLALAVSQTAGADTLRYDGAFFSPYLSDSFTIHDGDPTVLDKNVKAGAFLMTDTSGSTLPADTSFRAWCVDIYDTISSSTDYTLKSGGDFYGGANSYKVEDLERLASYVFDNGLLTNNVRSAGFQLAVWEIVNELSTAAAYRIDEAGGGDFYVTGIDTVDEGDAFGFATTWLGVVNEGTYAISQTLSVWDKDCPSCTQDLAVFAIPEPETYAMLLAGIGLLGFVAHRRRKGAGG